MNDIIFLSYHYIRLTAVLALKVSLMCQSQPVPLQEGLVSSRGYWGVLLTTARDCLFIAATCWGFGLIGQGILASKLNLPEDDCLQLLCLTPELPPLPLHHPPLSLQKKNHQGNEQCTRLLFATIRFDATFLGLIPACCNISVGPADQLGCRICTACM